MKTFVYRESGICINNIFHDLLKKLNMPGLSLGDTYDLLKGERTVDFNRFFQRNLQDAFGSFVKHLPRERATVGRIKSKDIEFHCLHYPDEWGLELKFGQDKDDLILDILLMLDKDRLLKSKVTIDGIQLKAGEWLAAALFKACGDLAGCLATIDEAQDRA